MKNIIILLTAILTLTISCTTEPNIEEIRYSHDLEFTADTLGGFQSHVQDIWGASEDDVFAVGWFYDYPTKGENTNVLHWDGSSWKKLNIALGEAEAIHGINKDYLWIAGSYSIGWPNSSPLLINKNQDTWSFTKLKDTVDLLDVWGTSEKNYYACGKNGYLIRYNGTVWKKKSLNTNLDLNCIWGTDSDDIYVAGTDFKGTAALFYFDGKKWEKLFENNSPSNGIYGMISSIWAENKEEYYILSGAGLSMGSNNKWNIITDYSTKVHQTKIFGKNKNIFTVGHMGTINYWNGMDWHFYSDNYDRYDGDLYLSGTIINETIYIIGITEPFPQGVILKSILKRE